MLPEPHDFKTSIITRDEINFETEKMEMFTTGQPIKDELEIGAFEPEEIDLPGDITSDEEVELPGTRRPKKGEGWWGVGPSIKPLRKGVPRDFVDGAGLCSPGRWPPSQRRLPDGHAARRLQGVVLEGLRKCEGIWKKADPNMDLKRMLLLLAVGRVPEMPFDQDVIAEIRSDLRLICKESGGGDGLPREGDVIQAFEVRLIQALLTIFEDPDEYFCSWWARGTWLGSPIRKLPRAPAIFDRKTKWRRFENAEEMHGGWQANYPSLVEHAELVQRQFEAEEAEDLMCRTTLGDAMEV